MLDSSHVPLARRPRFSFSIALKASGWPFHSLRSSNLCTNACGGLRVGSNGWKRPVGADGLILQKKGKYAELCRLIWVAQIDLPLCPLEFVECVSIKSLVFFSLKSSFLRIFPGDQAARPPRTQWAPKLLFFCRWVWKPMW